MRELFLYSRHACSASSMVSIVSGVDIAINPRDDPGVLIRYSIELINERKQYQYTLHQHVSFAAVSTILLQNN